MVNIGRHFFRNNSEWNATDSYIFDYASLGVAAFEHANRSSPKLFCLFRNDEALSLQHDQKLEIERGYLRRQAFQYAEV